MIQLILHLIGDYITRSVFPVVPREYLPDSPLADVELLGKRPLGYASRFVADAYLADLVSRKPRVMVGLAARQARDSLPSRPMLSATRDVFRALFGPVASSGNHVRGILLRCPWGEMGRVAARWIIASVPKHDPMWNRSDQLLVSEAMGAYCFSDSLPIPVEKSVTAVHFRARPFPAGRRLSLLNFRPKL